MNASLRGENPKQCSFLCLIYVNHESFHKWNKRYCERLVLPSRAHRSSPTQSIPYFWQLLPRPGNMPTGTFFFRATTFPLIARMPCGATVHTLPQTPSQVMPAAHRHICSSPRYSSPAHERWRERGERGRASGLFQKKKKKWAVLLSKNFPHIAVKRRTQGNCQEQKVGKRSQHVKWMI